MHRTRPPAGGTWVQTVSREPERFTVEFSFYPAYVQAAWNTLTGIRPAGPATRGDGLPAEESLLLDDSVPYNGSSLLVRVSLIRAPKRAEHYHMRVQVAAPTSMKRNGKLFLEWDDYKYSIPLYAGAMLFEDISPPDFSRHKRNMPSPRLRLRLEVDAPPKNGKHS